MKRDMQIVRKLIHYLESAEAGIETQEIELEIDDATLEYHLRLITEAGLIESTTMRGGRIFERLTWKGHEFADAARDDVIWKRTFRLIGKTTQTVTFDVLLTLLNGTLAKTYLGGS